MSSRMNKTLRKSQHMRKRLHKLAWTKHLTAKVRISLIMFTRENGFYATLLQGKSHKFSYKSKFSNLNLSDVNWTNYGSRL